VAARSLKVFALPLRAVAVGWGRQGAFWLLHLRAARGGHSQPQPHWVYAGSGDAGAAAGNVCRPGAGPGRSCGSCA